MSLPEQKSAENLEIKESALVTAGWSAEALQGGGASGYSSIGRGNCMTAKNDDTSHQKDIVAA